MFEHIQTADLSLVLRNLSTVTDRLFVAVPLGDGQKYVVPEYENDITHVLREDKAWWAEMFEDNGWRVQFFSYLLKGVKDNWSHYPEGNGFFVLNCR